MRTLASIAVLFACLAAPAAAGTRNFGISGFERIRVTGPFKVRVTTGVAPFGRATGSQGGVDRVTMKVEGRTLVVALDRFAGGNSGASPGPVEIEIGTHDLAKASLSGAGSLAIDKVRGLEFDLLVNGSGNAAVGSSTVDKLGITLLGNASATIAGSAPELKAIVRGGGALEAGALAVKDATLDAQGSAQVTANVTNSAKIDARGTANVILTGEPACTIRALGSASVSGCD